MLSNGMLEGFDDLPPDGVLLVEEAGIVEEDEELAVRAMRALRARHGGGAAHMRLGIELGRQIRIARPAGAGAVRAAGLRHEAVDDAVEHDSIVETFVHQRLDALDMLRRQVGPKLDHDIAPGGFKRQLFSISHGTSACLRLRISIKFTRNTRPATAPPIVSVNGIGEQRSIASATAA